MLRGGAESCCVLDGLSRFERGYVFSESTTSLSIRICTICALSPAISAWLGYGIGRERGADRARSEW